MGGSATAFVREQLSKVPVKETVETLRLSKCGMLIGSDGALYDPLLPIPEHVAFTHGETIKPGLPILFVNGINCEVSDAVCLAQQLSESTQVPVYALYNQTINLVHDITQSATDKLNVTSKPAADTLCDIICSALRNSKPLHVAAHSHGAVIVSTALSRAIEKLRTEQNFAPEELARVLRGVTVETFGGAATAYPDGPRYIHYVNLRDTVAWYAGVARFGLLSSDIERNEAKLVKSHAHVLVAAISKATRELIRPGAGATIRRIETPDHELAETDVHALQHYLSARIDPCQLPYIEAESGPDEVTENTWNFAALRNKASQLKSQVTATIRDLKDRFSAESSDAS
jgi:hypothetical protein